MTGSTRPSPNCAPPSPRNEDWRAQKRRPFHLYSPAFIAMTPERRVDRLAEDAVGGQERIVELVMTGRARPGAMSEGGN